MRTLILVEDDPLDATLAKRALRKISPNLPLVHLKDGVAFLEYIKDKGTSNILLAIMDLKMPRLGGLDVLRQLSRFTKRPVFPIIIFSSSSQDTDVKRCYSSGCNAFVNKPIRHDEYASVMNSISSFWVDHNEVPLTSS